ncbi:hypothetical protein ABE41_016820 [Fictibacillus arsenicus]|uniref:Uncharacterized protein n=1 Tax=Fictibacillus arsenicus TaxID=255247 RepID=A0A1B1Z8A4_9BACL|nr:hypothetical protein [Fictibacillus arsenicus]ANX13674.1 hypothetical protein ABE41_016820 [Fictibacillus arsenicus]
MEKAELERDSASQQKMRSEKNKTIILTLVLSFFIIGGFGTWGYYALFGAKSASDFDLPSNEEVAAAEKTSGTSIYKPTLKVPVTEIQRRINVMHEYWNRKLGFNAWNNYSVSRNKEELMNVKEDIQNKIQPFVSGPLKVDMETAVAKIDSSMKSDSVEPLKGVHRIFHDLDITLNGYEQDGVYWEVTETWKWYQKAH